MKFAFLANNIAIMLAVSLIYGIVLGRWRKDTFIRRVILGFFFGIVTLWVMLNSYELASGVIFDCRSVVLSVAALFCGPLTATISASLAAIFRIGQGGAGTLTGVLIIACSTIIGVWFYYLRRNHPRILSPLYLYLFGLIVHTVFFVVMATLPYEISIKVYKELGLPVFILFPVGTVLLGLLLKDRQQKVANKNALAEYNKKLVEVNKKLKSEIDLHKQTKKELSQSEEYFKRAVSEAPLPIMIHSSDGSVLLISKEWTRLSGYKREEITNVYRWVEKVHSGDVETINKELEKVYASDRRVDGTYELIAKDGSELIWEFSSVSLGNLSNGKVLVITIAVDVTERRKAEHSLLKAKEKAEDINRYLEMQTLFANEMAAKAEAANIAKSQFLANMSHEIRTPMNAIVGFSNFLAEENLTKRQKHDVDIIIESSNILLNVINDVLDFSKIEAGELDSEIIECSLEKILYSVESLMRPKSSEKKLEFKIIKSDDVPRKIYTDPTRLNQCLINLIGNAIKFTAEGYVHLRVSMKNKGGKEYIRFDIQDTGIGIPEDKQKVIFEPFRQADGSTTRRYGGTGLGLAITKQLADLLGGSLRLKSKPGEGTTFTLMVPIGEADDAETTALNSEQSSYDRSFESGEDDLHDFDAKVLVAEDAKTNQVFIKRLLEQYGLDVTIVSDGREAVHQAFMDGYDIIFMDMQMPKVNGYEATEMIRKAKINTPIVALTANAMKGDDKKCYEAGCNSYLAKPVQSEDLVGVLRKYLTS